jgi:hypothetical protein
MLEFGRVGEFHVHFERDEMDVFMLRGFENNWFGVSTDGNAGLVAEKPCPPSRKKVSEFR